MVFPGGGESPAGGASQQGASYVYRTPSSVRKALFNGFSPRFIFEKSDPGVLQQVLAESHLTHAVLADKVCDAGVADLDAIDRIPIGSEFLARLLKARWNPRVDDLTKERAHALAQTMEALAKSRRGETVSGRNYYPFTVHDVAERPERNTSADYSLDDSR